MLHDVLPAYRVHGFPPSPSTTSALATRGSHGPARSNRTSQDRPPACPWVTTDPVKQAVTAKLVGLSHQIGASVVAEGIEDEVDARPVESFDVDLLQSYLVGHPKLLD